MRQEPSLREKIAAAAMALAGGVAVAAMAHAVGLGGPASLIVLVPYFLMIAPARIVAGLTAVARRAGLCAAVVIAAVRNTAEAALSIFAGAALRLLAQACARHASYQHAVRSARVPLRRARDANPRLSAQALAARGVIAPTLAAQILPTLRAADASAATT
jgi:transposase-like protein